MPLVTRPVCIQTLGRFAAAILLVLHHLNVMSLHVFGVSGCPVWGIVYETRSTRDMATILDNITHWLAFSEKPIYQ